MLGRYPIYQLYSCKSQKIKKKKFKIFVQPQINYFRRITCRLIFQVIMFYQDPKRKINSSMTKKSPCTYNEEEKMSALLSSFNFGPSLLYTNFMYKAVYGLCMCLCIFACSMMRALLISQILKLVKFFIDLSKFTYGRNRRAFVGHMANIYVHLRLGLFHALCLGDCVVSVILAFCGLWCLTSHLRFVDKTFYLAWLHCYLTLCLLQFCALFAQLVMFHVLQNRKVDKVVDLFLFN